MPSITRHTELSNIGAVLPLVMPAQAGIQASSKRLDPSLRWDDDQSKGSRDAVDLYLDALVSGHMALITAWVCVSAQR